MTQPRNALPAYICPGCRKPVATGVVDVRVTSYRGESCLKRRRRCDECHTTFATLELMAVQSGPGNSLVPTSSTGSDSPRVRRAFEALAHEIRAAARGRSA